MVAFSLSLSKDPAWPWNLPFIGLPALGLIALVLVAFTVWTYAMSPRRGIWRLIVALIALRLLALCLVVLCLLRPAFGYSDGIPLPGTLLIVIDSSESMTIQDEQNNQQTRWAALQAALARSEPALKQLQGRQNITIVWHRFADDIADYDPAARADGQRSDYGQALHALHERYSKERGLRGLIILGDGADNGTRYQPIAEAARWRSLSCPVYTFSLGQTSTTSRQRDIAVVSMTPEPSVVPVKGKLTIRGVINAPGYENTEAKIRILIDDQEAAVQDEVLRKSEGNEVTITLDAPAKEGEIKVTLKVDPPRDEAIQTNNKAEAIVTVIKEGIRVLYVEGKDRAWEPRFIREALGTDPRIHLYEAVRQNNEPLPAEQEEWFQFSKQHYDVIIIGDISALRLSGGKPEALVEIYNMVRQGTGLLMIGGYESFGNSDWKDVHWKDDKGKSVYFADLLPVELDAAGQIEEEVKFEPTEDGYRHFLLRLSADPEQSKTIWTDLKFPRLAGMTTLGTPKANATTYANSNRGARMLVGGTFGEGRTLAFAADSTWLWRNYDLLKSQKGIEVHARFWRQVVLWLAKQEAAQGAIWIKPDSRRVPAGGKLGFSVGMRGKGGVELKDARFEARVINPRDEKSALETTREDNQERGTVEKDRTGLPGEYKIEITGTGTDSDGTKIKAKETARFLVYQDETEMLRQSADHELLAKLAAAGNGKAHQVSELPAFLDRLQSESLPQFQPRTSTWPDWQRTPASKSMSDQITTLLGSGILPFFLLFVAVLCVEWALRRYWGMA